MENNTFCVLMKHGEDDYSLWQPEIPADDPLLVALLDKYGNSGGSVRSNGEEILKETISSLGIQKQHVHLIVYYDPDYEYVGCDVFDSFEVAHEQFNSRLQDVKAEYPDDPDWVEVLEYDLEKRDLLFRTHNGYEVFYCHEAVQSEAFHITDCHFCGRPYSQNEYGHSLHRCNLCNKTFCNSCYESMTGTTDFKPNEHSVLLCPSCELKSSIRFLISEWLSDYAKQMPDSFYEDIFDDVCETSGFNRGEGYNDSDIRLSFSRVIVKQFGVEEE